VAARLTIEPERQVILLEALLQAAYRKSGSSVFSASEKPENREQGK
jgi:hypothetical protein